MVRRLALVAALLLCAPAAAQDSCRLCYSSGTTAPGERPLAIEIWADLNFSKLALTGRSGGSAELSATGGGKQTTGEVIDLGGVSVTGHGRITGVPLREVRIELPDRVDMTTGDGGHANGMGDQHNRAACLGHSIFDGSRPMCTRGQAEIRMRNARGIFQP